MALALSSANTSSANRPVRALPAAGSKRRRPVSTAPCPCSRRHCRTAWPRPPFGSERGSSRGSRTHGCSRLRAGRRRRCALGRHETSCWSGFSELGRLDHRRAARLGAQLATQLAALEHEGIAPASVESGDIVVEGAGDAERAWLLPDPARAIAADAEGATRALAVLLNGLAGRNLLSDPPSAPQALADELRSIDSARNSRVRWVALAAVVAAVALAAVLAVVLGGRGGKQKATAAPATTPAARITARIPVGDAVADLAAGPTAVWITLGGGGRLQIDPKTNAVVGAPVQIARKDSFMGLVEAGDRLWAYGDGKLIRFDAATGHVRLARSSASRKGCSPCAQSAAGCGRRSSTASRKRGGSQASTP